MISDEIERFYQEQLIGEGVALEDAEKAAYILRHVDGFRQRTEEEQEFISSIWNYLLQVLPHCSKKWLSLLANPIFIMVDNTLINPTHVITVHLDFQVPDAPIENSVLLCFTNGSKLNFIGSSADQLRRYFLHQNRTVSLDTIYAMEEP